MPTLRETRLRGRKAGSLVERTDGVAGAERAERHELDERLERAELLEHAELLERSERHERAQRNERVAADVVQVALVLAGNDLCFVAAARSPDALTRRLGEYVREWAPLQLWPDDARWVDELLGAGRVKDAVAHYFKAVGGRWDHERLVLTTAAGGE